MSHPDKEPCANCGKLVGETEPHDCYISEIKHYVHFSPAEDGIPEQRKQTLVYWITGARVDLTTNKVVERFHRKATLDDVGVRPT